MTCAGSAAQRARGHTTANSRLTIPKVTVRISHCIVTSPLQSHHEFVASWAPRTEVDSLEHSTGYAAQAKKIFFNWLRVLDTAASSQVDQRVGHQLHTIMALLDAFKAESLNLSHFVARQIWRRRGLFPLRCRAHRLQRRG